MDEAFAACSHSARLQLVAEGPKNYPLSEGVIFQLEEHWLSAATLVAD